MNPDKRIVFAIPCEDALTLIGSTDVDYQGEPCQADVSADGRTGCRLAGATTGRRDIAYFAWRTSHPSISGKRSCLTLIRSPISATAVSASRRDPSARLAAA